MRTRATATFRFYAELNDFLTPANRRREVTLLCAEQATVKHQVEALGVPHTEVELVLVNGAPAPLERLLAEGDRVAVYPRRTRLLEKPSAQPPRFIADAHLGGLARQLRMAGFDTLYANTFDDGHIAQAGAEQQRIVLTRDRDLLKRRTVVAGCYVRAQEPAAQFAEVAARYALPPLARPFTLCLHCNAPLEPVPKAAVLDRLPPAVRDTQDEFSFCPCCRRVYWKGSHWKRMAAMLAGALGTPGADQP
ncbi:MAG: Mut7-C RNAse domain-containing protein [Telluria sp.]